MIILYWQFFRHAQRVGGEDGVGGWLGKNHMGAVRSEHTIPAALQYDFQIMGSKQNVAHLVHD